jgi:uncharacterized protein (DUF342 family)
MVKQTTNEIEERAEEIRRLLITMRWDIEHNQFNESKRLYYTKLEKEYADLNEQIEKLRGSDNGTNQNISSEKSD